jgi:hypothetical protein
MVTVGDIAGAGIVAESGGPIAERAEEVNINHILAAEGVGKLGGWKRRGWTSTEIVPEI